MAKVKMAILREAGGMLEEVMEEDTTAGFQRQLGYSHSSDYLRNDDYPVHILWSEANAHMDLNDPILSPCGLKHKKGPILFYRSGGLKPNDIADIETWRLEGRLTVDETNDTPIQALVVRPGDPPRLEEIPRDSTLWKQVCGGAVTHRITDKKRCITAAYLTEQGSAATARVNRKIKAPDFNSVVLKGTFILFKRDVGGRPTDMLFDDVQAAEIYVRKE